MKAFLIVALMACGAMGNPVDTPITDGALNAVRTVLRLPELGTRTMLGTIFQNPLQQQANWLTQLSPAALQQMGINPQVFMNSMQNMLAMNPGMSFLQATTGTLASVGQAFQQGSMGILNGAGGAVKSGVDAFVNVGGALAGGMGAFAALPNQMAQGGNSMLPHVSAQAQQTANQIATVAAQQADQAAIQAQLAQQLATQGTGK